MRSEYEFHLAEATTPITPEPPARLHGDVVDWLNRCLRTELSAVESYDLAIRMIGRNELTDILRQIRASHERRVHTLQQYLLAAGHTPSESSGAWGAFAKTVQVGADLLGERAALTALEQAEDHVASVYSGQTLPVDDRTWTMLESQILPEQRRTSDLSHSLLHFVQDD